LRRARLLVAFAFASFPIGATFLLLTISAYGATVVTFSAALGAVSAALTPFVLARTGSIKIATNGMLTAFAASIATASLVAERQQWAAIAWLATLPLLATAMAGRRIGAAWGGISASVVALEDLVDHAALIPKYPTPPSLARFGNSFSIVLLIL